jgi:hypothetical protein
VIQTKQSLPYDWAGSLLLGSRLASWNALKQAKYMRKESFVIIIGIKVTIAVAPSGD